MYMRFADANVDSGVARAVVSARWQEFWLISGRAKINSTLPAIMVSTSSLGQMKSAMLIRMQAPRRRSPNGRFLPAAAAAATAAAAPPPAPPPPPPFPPVFAPPNGRPRRRKEEARARLICILGTWCHRCVRRLGDDKLVVCVPPSEPRAQKCDRCSPVKHRCDPNSAPVQHQLRLRQDAAIAVTNPCPLDEKMFRRKWYTPSTRARDLRHD